MREELIKLLIDVNFIENEELNLRSDNVRNREDAIPMVKEFDKTLKWSNKEILNFGYKQGLLF